MRYALFAFAVSSLTVIVAFARAGEAEDAAVKLVADLKGSVTRDDNALGKPVIGVDLGKRKVTNEELKRLIALKDLQKLDLGYTQVTDEGVRELAAFKHLRSLSLRSTKLTDEALKDLAVLKGLEDLDLGANKITGSGLGELASLKDLRSLNLGYNNIPPAALRKLADLKQLRMLTLPRISDAGMKEIAALTELEELDLGSTIGKNVTDSGLEELAALKKLKVLRLGPVAKGRKITWAGVAELQKALPECKITGAPPKERWIDVEINHNQDAKSVWICVPLSLEKADAGKHELLVDIEGGLKAKPTVLGQLTAPGIMTEHIKPAADGLVRRDLHFQMYGPFTAGTVTKAKVQLANRANFVGFTYSWRDKDREYSELSQNSGKFLVLRYVHEGYDNATKESRLATNKVFHHLYDPNPRNPRFITNGGDTNRPLPKDPKDNLYPHHRGLFYAFNKITFDGDKECDTWHAMPGDTHQAHVKFLTTEDGMVLARQRVAINWHGPKDQVFAKEEREVTVYSTPGPGEGLKATMVDFASRLTSAGGLVKLRGDPQHAGFQFRAHNDLHEQKREKDTYFLRPDGKGELGDTRNWDPKTGKGPVNLPWDACSFVLDDNRYTVAYLSHPQNPGASRWSERSYGRFGCCFEYDLTEKNPLVVSYRIWLQNGEMTVEEAAALSKAFRESPKLTIKQP